jgi:anti-sigma-K factor RskA
MPYHGGWLSPKTNLVATAVVVVVGVSVAMMFGLLYTLTPPTVATVEHKYTQSAQNQQ